MQGYGKRNAVESFFASMKAIYGKRLVGDRWDRMVQEVILKMHVYNVLVGLSMPSRAG